MPTASAMWAKPSAWNSGAETTVASSERIGTLSTSTPIGASDFGLSRGAPFGVPVVPLVRTMTFDSSAGSGGGESSPAAISASTVSSPGSSVQARDRAELGLVAAEELRVLVVVDQQPRTLAIADLADLRPGEVGVEAGSGGRRPCRRRTSRR